MEKKIAYLISAYTEPKSLANLVGAHTDMNLKRRITLVNLFLARNGRGRAEYIRNEK
jgi:hypothetical protein